MKAKFLLICVFLFAASCIKAQVEDVKKKSDLRWISDSMCFNGRSPYTGEVIDYPGSKFDRTKLLYDGHFREGQRNGIIKKWYPNFKVESTENYKMGLRNGKQIRFYRNGNKKSEYSAVDGLPDGLCTEWYENGQKSKEESYMLGITLKKTEWNPNGIQRCELTYREGKVSDGDYKFTDEKGVEYTVAFAKGFLSKETYSDRHFVGFHPNGMKKDEGRCNEKGEIDGLYVSWWPNGQKQSEVTETGGLYEGKFSEWYENGAPKTLSNYRNNKPDGVTYTYDESGGKTLLLYENGKLVKKALQTEANLVSNNVPSSNLLLFYCLSGADHDTSFIKLTIDDGSSNDSYKNTITDAIVTCMNNRFKKITKGNLHEFGNQYLSYFFTVSDISTTSQAVNYNSKCVDKNLKYYDCVRTGYKATCHYKLTLSDATGNLLYNGNTSFATPDFGDLFVHISQSAEEAIQYTVKQANSQYAVYHFFPIHTYITELTKISGDTKVKKVVISAGSDSGVYEGLNFYMLTQDSWTNGIVKAKLIVTEVNPGTAVCKVDSGNEDIFHRFNSNDKKVKIYSNR